MCFVFFFFKKKTAYELLSCDCISVVCSSDLDLLVSSQIRCTPLVYAGAMRRYRVRPLAFWPGWMWVDALVDKKQEAASAAFLYGPYGAHELDGTSALIHDVNEGGAR